MYSLVFEIIIFFFNNYISLIGLKFNYVSCLHNLNLWSILSSSPLTTHEVGLGSFIHGASHLIQCVVFQLWDLVFATWHGSSPWALPSFSSYFFSWWARSFIFLFGHFPFTFSYTWGFNFGPIRTFHLNLLQLHLYVHIPLILKWEV